MIVWTLSPQAKAWITTNFRRYHNVRLVSGTSCPNISFNHLWLQFQMANSNMSMSAHARKDVQAQHMLLSHKSMLSLIITTCISSPTCAQASPCSSSQEPYTLSDLSMSPGRCPMSGAGAASGYPAPNPASGTLPRHPYADTPCSQTQGSCQPIRHLTGQQLVAES